MIGMTSSVTATMRSPKVVRITFRCRMFFSSTHSPNVYLLSFQVGRISLVSKLCTRVDRTLGNICNLRNQDFTIWRGRDRYEGYTTSYRQVSECRLYLRRVLPSFFIRV